VSKKIWLQTAKDQSSPRLFQKTPCFFSEIMLQKEDKTVSYAIINQNNQSKNKL
jgi:hypothetical protein